MVIQVTKLLHFQLHSNLQHAYTIFLILCIHKPKYYMQIYLKKKTAETQKQSAAAVAALKTEKDVF